MNSSMVRYLNKNFDEISILTCLADVTFAGSTALDEQGQTILSALRRSSEEFKFSSVEEIGARLATYNDDQIQGLVSNVKGIAHEMEFVKIENADGDSIYANLYSDTNHPGYDVQLYDESTGEYWDVQLKATDSQSYVTQWIDQHPDGEIIVTEELAVGLNIESSGVQNSELTAKVSDFVDGLIDHNDVSTLSNYFPMLTFASVAIIIWELWQRYQSGEISYLRFKLLAGLSAGKKVVKFGAIMGLLSVPGINVIVGAALVAKLIYSAAELSTGQLDKIRYS
jgi:hypothetical protein